MRSSERKSPLKWRSVLLLFRCTFQRTTHKTFPAVGICLNYDMIGRNAWFVLWSHKFQDAKPRRVSCEAGLPSLWPVCTTEGHRTTCSNCSGCSTLSLGPGWCMGCPGSADSSFWICIHPPRRRSCAFLWIGTSFCVWNQSQPLPPPPLPNIPYLFIWSTSSLIHFTQH